MTDGLQWMPIFMGMTEHSCHTNFLKWAFRELVLARYSFTKIT